MPIPAFWVNEKAKIVHVNQAACKQLEYSFDELTEKGIRDISLNFQPFQWNELFMLIAEKTYYQFESRHISKSGKIIPVEVSASFIEVNGKKFILGFAYEISERMLNEYLSRENSLMLEAFFSYIDDALGVLDTQHNILHYNQAAKNLLKLSDDLYIGKKCYEILGYNSVCEDCPSKKVFETSKPVKTEKKVPGTDLWLEIHSFPIFNQENVVVKVVEHMRDISERKKTEKRLYEIIGELKASEQEQRLSHFVIDNVGHAIFMINENGDFVRTNAFATKLWGYSMEELKSLNVLQINQTINKKEWKQVWNNLKQNKSLHFESIHTHKNGEKINVEINSNYFVFEGKEFSVGFAHDITQRKKSERKLKEALNEIQHLKQKLEAENIYLQDEIKLEHNFEEIVTQNNRLKMILRDVEKVASTDSTVLILGETGTGKELIARAIHNISKRKNHPLVKVNCASLPSNLIESELFGYEKGAFTGALTRKIGRFELADNGTLFLDEIGELPVELQPKLLRVLQDGEFERLGSTKTIKVNVRLIAATNRKLADEVQKGNFRADLYYRINVFPVLLPPLRERKEDIPLLTNHFIYKYSAKIGKNISSISHKTIAKFQLYDWPGNIRELENVIERAMITSIGNELEYQGDIISLNNFSAYENDLSLSSYEKEYILKILRTTDFRIRGEKGAAKILGLKPTTLEARIKKLGIKK